MTAWGILLSKQTWVRIAQHVLRQLLFVLLIVIVNPFEIASDNDRRVLGQWQALYGEQYAADYAKTKPPGQSGLDKVTVLTISEEEEREIALGQTLDTFHFAELLQQVINNSTDVSGNAVPPRAVFMDLFLDHGIPMDWSGDGARIVDLTGPEIQACINGRTDPGFRPFRCAMYAIGQITKYDAWKVDENCFKNPVAKIACIRSAEGVPVIFAVKQSPIHHGPRADSRRLEPGEEALQRVAVIAPVEVATDRYWLLAPEDHRGRDPFDLSPAAALYWAYCSGADKKDPAGAGIIERQCSEIPVRRPSTAEDAAPWERTKEGWGWSNDFKPRLETVWAIGNEDEYTKQLTAIEDGTRETNCRMAKASVATMPAAIMEHLTSGLAQDDPETMAPAERPCLYPHRLPYTELGRIKPPITQLALADKLILIGRDGDDADMVEAKAVGRAPGVFLHAMALQNLIDRGKCYAKAAHRYLPWLNFTDRDLNALIPSVWVMLLGGLSVVILREGFAQGSGGWRRIGMKALIILVFLMLAVAVPLIWPEPVASPTPCATDGLRAPTESEGFWGWLNHPVPASFGRSALLLTLVVESVAVLLEALEPLRERLVQKGGFLKFMFGKL